jgi:hypothetical protein
MLQVRENRTIHIVEEATIESTELQEPIAKLVIYRDEDALKYRILYSCTALHTKKAWLKQGKRTMTQDLCRRKLLLALAMQCKDITSSKMHRIPSFLLNTTLSDTNNFLHFLPSASMCVCVCVCQSVGVVGSVSVSLFAGVSAKDILSNFTC